MVLHVAQVVPTILLIPVPLQEPLLVLEPQRYRKHDQKLLDYPLVDTFRERLDRVPVLPHDVRVRPTGVRRGELGDVVDLEVVLHARDEVASSRGLPAVVVALLQGGAVGSLGRVREGQDRVREGELGIDLGGFKTMVGDVEEACVVG